MRTRVRMRARIYTHHIYTHTQMCEKERETDRQVGRQANRQTDRDTEIKMQRQMKTLG